jgi:hypothetical protein
MKNDYLNNKKKYSSYRDLKNLDKKLQNPTPKNVDINKLLNRVKIKEKTIKRENMIMFGFTTLILSCVLIFTVLY